MIVEQVNRLIKVRELKLLLGQFETLHSQYAEKFILVENPAKTVLENFSEFARIHKNLQEKLQEIADFYFKNRETFFSYAGIEEDVMILLNVGAEQDVMYFNILDMIQDLKTEKE